MAVLAAMDFPDGAVVPDLDVAWIHGSEAAKYNTDPDIQVHACDEHTYILRQNKAVHYEAPFMFLLFGASRAVLLDTGATANPEFFPLRRTVDAIIDGWLATHPHPDDYELLVLHSHGHGDHVAADGQFLDRPDTVLIGAARDAAWPFFGFDRLPESVAKLDLGGRVVDCLATPGHHNAAVTYYDRYTGILFTGDTVYPGRLYVFDWPAFVRSIDRLVGWCRERPVSYLLGCHIEMFNKTGGGLPGRLDLPAGRNPARADHGPAMGDPAHARSPRLPARSLRPTAADHHTGRVGPA